MFTILERAAAIQNRDKIMLPSEPVENRLTYLVLNITEQAGSIMEAQLMEIKTGNVKVAQLDCKSLVILWTGAEHAKDLEVDHRKIKNDKSAIAKAASFRKREKEATVTYEPICSCTNTQLERSNGKHNCTPNLPILNDLADRLANA